VHKIRAKRRGTSGTVLWRERERVPLIGFDVLNIHCFCQQIFKCVLKFKFFVEKFTPIIFLRDNVSVGM